MYDQKNTGCDMANIYELTEKKKSKPTQTLTNFNLTHQKQNYVEYVKQTNQTLLTIKHAFFLPNQQIH
jgi:hypothetical protein